MTGLMKTKCPLRICDWRFENADMDVMQEAIKEHVTSHRLKGDDMKDLKPDGQRGCC